MKTFTFSIVIFITIFFSENIFSQNNIPKNTDYLSKLRQIAMFKDNPDWITIKSEKSINAKRIFELYKDAFGLKKSDNMQLVLTKTDKLNITTYKFQQYYKGIPVEGASYMVHEKNGKAIKANGRPVRNLEVSNIPSVTAKDAINKAISFVNASQYMWEDPAAEKMLKQIKGKENATYYPNAELVYMDKKFSQDPSAYKLAYKLEVYSQIPIKRLFVYIDAQSGKIIHSINMIQNTDKSVIAPTRYNNNRPIVIDSINPNSYRLRETGRGNGIRTFDLHNTTTYASATDITDTDTIFSNDIVANNAHWAAEMTYDYYLQKHGRNSFNDLGGVLLSYVHFDVNVANAQWDGIRMSYGDGNGTMSEFTTIDICGHEITHGVTQYSADLVYQDEPGAMNEAFSDIFGTCIEFFADETPNWDMGEDIGDPIRSMSNPKLHSQPNTYHGQYWDTDPNNFDNGGVHTNSGVLNYWFYLLCVGGTGTNDIGSTYNVNAIGMDTAAAIAYRMLTAYLTESSQYMDAYNAGLNAASDLYGSCSSVEKEVAAAFAAVGVGYPISNDKVYLTDITSPITKCGLSDEQLKIKLLYNGCNSGLPAGDSVVIAYRLDNGTMNYDTMIISNIWNGGDTLNYIVPQTLSITTVGQHKVDVWVKYLTDSTITYNDSIKNYYFDNLLQQNIDFGMAKITSPHSGCGLSANEIVQAKFIFFGCDSFPAGDTIALVYSLNSGAQVTENYITQATIYPGDTITYTFLTPLDISALNGVLHLDVWTDYNVDSLTTNDAVSYSFANPISLSNDTVTFDLPSAFNYFYVETTIFSKAFTSQVASHTSYKGLQMTGGNPMLYLDQLQFPDGMNTWTVNEFLSAKANFCVDATGWTNAFLKFDLKQTHGGTFYQMYQPGYDFTKASNLRILVNGQQVGDTYNPSTPSSDPWVVHTVNLSQYAGTEFVITIETRNVGKDTLIYKLDNAYIDNFVFYQCVASVAAYTYVANNLSVNFTNQSVNATSYLWKFGDNTTSTLQNPQHTFSTPGDYLVKLYSTNECGTDSSEITIQVVCITTDASYTYVANNLSVDFSNQSVNATSYLWNFGDNATSTLQNPQHTFSTPGDYLVKLFSYNDCSTDSSEITIQVVCIAADASYTYVANNLSLDFTNQSVNATSYLWNFGDNVTSTLQNPQHTFSTPGDYLVKLFSYNDCSTDSSEITLNVVCNIPNTIFSWDSTYLSVNFINQSTGALTYLWNFGDGDTTSTQNPVHVYQVAGNYVVSLIATNSCGTDTFKLSVLVVSGIPENNIYNVQVYPNPVKNKLYINFSGTAAVEKVDIRMMDITGRLIFDKQTMTRGIFEIPVIRTSSGIYIIEISGSSAIRRLRVEVE